MIHRRGWLSFFLVLCGVLSIIGGTLLIGDGEKSSPDVGQGATQSQADFLRAEKARLGALVAGPFDIEDAKVTFDAAVRRLYDVATTPGHPIWDAAGRRLLDRYRLAGEAQFDALDHGDIAAAVQIAANDGTMSGTDLQDLLSRDRRPIPKEDPRDFRGLVVIVAGVLLLWLGARSRSPGKRPEAPKADVLRFSHEPSIVTNNIGVEIHRNAAVTKLLGDRPTPNLVELANQLGTKTAPHETWLECLPTDGSRSFAWIRQTPGGEQHIEVTASLFDINPPSYLWSLRNLTEQRRSERELVRKAFHDSLTDLPNRALFRDRTSQALAGSERTDTIISVLFIDLDGFKNVNDSLGHDAGDELIGEMGNRLRGLIRSSDTLARLGGDEFAVLIEDPRSDSPTGSLARSGDLRRRKHRDRGGRARH
jgi:GGDEF domain-containing protein